MEEVINATPATEQEPTIFDPTSMSSDELRSAAPTDTPIEPEEEAREEKAEVTPPVEDKTKAEEPPKEDTVSKAEYEKLKTRFDEQAKFNSRLATELGLLRKKTPAEINQKVQSIRDKYFEDPIAAQEEYEAFKSELRQEAQAIQANALNAAAAENRSLLLKNSPSLEASIPDMAKLLVEQDSEDPGWVEDFKRNPYVVRGTPIHPAILHNLHHRVILAKENADLKTQLDTLKAENDQLRKRPDEILKQVEREAGKRPVRAAGGEAPIETGTAGTMRVWAMSSEEIKEHQKKLRTG